MQFSRFALIVLAVSFVLNLSAQEKPAAPAETPPDGPSTAGRSAEPGRIGGVREAFRPGGRRSQSDGLDH